MSYLGIDPGIDGAIACLDEHGEIEDIFDMPTIVIGYRHAKKGKKPSPKRMPNPNFLYDVLSSWKDDSPLVATIESVNSYGGMGSVSAYSFGQTNGVLRSILLLLEIPTRFVTPKEWKGHYNLSDDKDASLELARAQWAGDEREWFRLKKHNDRAEAALIALYGMGTHDG